MTGLVQVSRTSATLGMRLGYSTSEKRQARSRGQQARYGELGLVLELVATQVQPWRALARATHRRGW
jgi:hypothetical protein